VVLNAVNGWAQNDVDTMASGALVWTLAHLFGHWRRVVISCRSKIDYTQFRSIFYLNFFAKHKVEK
jgi:hypothetical protein